MPRRQGGPGAGANAPRRRQTHALPRKPLGPDGRRPGRPWGFRGGKRDRHKRACAPSCGRALGGGSSGEQAFEA
eukprot:1465552-Alexandrium_andersonii.AAC.1